MRERRANAIVPARRCGCGIVNCNCGAGSATLLHDLPPKLETRLTIPLHRDQRESCEKAEREGIVYLRSLGAEVGIQHVLELITRLKQICNADPRTGASSKMDDIEDRLWTLAAQGHKALVFSQYTSDTSGVAGRGQPSAGVQPANPDRRYPGG